MPNFTDLIFTNLHLTETISQVVHSTLDLIVSISQVVHSTLDLIVSIPQAIHTIQGFIKPISQVAHNILDSFLPGLFLCGVCIIDIPTIYFMDIWNLLNATDVTPKYSLEGKRERDRQQRPTVDISYVLLIRNNVQYHLLIDVLDKTGINVKSIYPRTTHISCTYNGQEWTGLMFSGSAFARLSSSGSEQFKEITYTDQGTSHLGCWVPSPRKDLEAVENTNILSAARALVYAAGKRSVFARKQ